MKLYRNIGELLTLSGASAKKGRKTLESDLGILSAAALVVEKGKVYWVGAQKSLPRSYANKIKQEIDLKGATVLPGFIESHTHSVFAGSRAHEFELRNQGVSYLEITRQGGGIQSTVREVRKEKPARLLQLAQKRVDHFVRQGVTTLEVKSGYGLDLKTEAKMLKVIRLLRGPQIISTFLGAHSIPQEFSSAGQYLEELKKGLAKIRQEQLAKRVDIFIEKGFFEKDLAREYLKFAQSLGFQITIHADQMTLSGGSELAVELAALSADHVLQIGPKEIQKLAGSEVTAVMLPLADLYMDVPYPPARTLIDAGARVALATDFNPGTAPSQDINLTGFLARLKMKMTLPEVIAAYTIGAAYALHLQDSKGSLEVGKDADFLCTDLRWQDLFYSAGTPFVDQLFLKGKRIYLNKN